MNELDARLERYAEMLIERGPELGLVAEGDRGSLRERHVLDSLRASPALAGSRAYDLGSGAGLPGVPLAIAHPAMEFVLVESKRRRVAWLELVISELSLGNARVIHGRVEELSEPVDVCLARAFAPLDRCWEVAERLLLPGGRLVYFAGASLDRATVTGVSPGARLLDEGVVETAGSIVIIDR